MAKSWINSLKIAIINEDIEKLRDLYTTIPDFSNTDLSIEQMKEAKALIRQALEILKNRAEETRSALEQIKASIAYQKNMTTS